MRCLTLADELRTRGGACHFICRAQPGDLVAMIRSRGFSVAELSAEPVDFVRGPDDEVLPPHAQWLGCDWRTDAGKTQEIVAGMEPEWLVVDHYALDARWETALQSHVRRLMVIDDLADRSHVCDLLMDQNFFADMSTRYLGLVPSSCELLLGTTYMLLRPEFTEKSQSARQRSGHVRRIHVFFGGSDPTNQTRNVLLALGKLRLRGVEVDVVIGSSNPHRSQLQGMCESMPNVVLHCQVSNMAELIDKADLGIGAGGVAMWERCYLGLPTITVVFAENQVRTTEDVGRIGAIKYLGRCTAFTADEYEEAIKEMIESPEELRRMAKTSRELVRPGTQQVADVMERISRSNSLLI